MSQTCPNCGHTLSCGCQKRTASDGKSVCSQCVSNYERQLAAAKTEQSFTWVNGTLLQKPSS